MTNKDNGGPASDKIQQARRAAFDGWWLSEGLTLNDPTYGRYTTTTQAAWLGFNAALDCVVIELPPAFDDVHNYACYQGGWNDMRGESVDAIESTNLGVKVK